MPTLTPEEAGAVAEAKFRQRMREERARLATILTDSVWKPAIGMWTCPLCGAAVDEAAQYLHTTWHLRLLQ